jgi:hypothetical protein
MKQLQQSLLTLLLIFVIYFSSLAQCMMYPVSLEQRVRSSSVIALGEVTSKDCFTQKETGLIYTRNIVSVNVWLKGQLQQSQLAVLTLGGTDGDRSMIAYPALQLETGKEYVFMLEANTVTKNISKNMFRNTLPLFYPYAETQGALLNNDYLYTDAVHHTTIGEEALFHEIEKITGVKALRADGTLFSPRKQQSNTTGSARVTSISGFTPSVTNSGTIVTGDFLTISGSNFEAARGTGFVAFRNADNGGSNYIASALASDYVSWGPTSITVKVPRNAGTGDFFVRTNSGTDFASPSNLTVNYAHLSIDDDFLNFTSDTRQRYYLRNLNGLGGYTFTYNTTFFSNSPAVASFQRAIVSWRCGTGFNIRTSATTSSIAVAANDNVNIVSFDASLPAGVLARATSYFSGSGITGVCDLANTVWWLEELDIVFNNPPAAGFTWEFGPAAPSGTEYDFESVAVHEIGHLHGLGHIIAPGQIMHYALANGTSARTLAARDIAAGNTKMSYSTPATCFNPAGSGTPITAVAGGSCSTLPVTLTVFTGKRVNSTVNLLNWETEQEFNNDGFTVERSDDGQLFSQLLFIKGKGQSTVRSSYSYTDQQAGPFKRFYRLAQKDFDGKITYSSVVALDGDAGTGWKIWMSNSTLFLYNSAPLEKTATLQLFTSNGQLMLSKQITSSAITIPVSLSSKAVYSYRLITNREVITGKLSNSF